MRLYKKLFFLASLLITIFPLQAEPQISDVQGLYNNFLTNLFAGILAYILKPKKPSVSFSKTIDSKLALMSN